MSSTDLAEVANLINLAITIENLERIRNLLERIHALLAHMTRQHRLGLGYWFQNKSRIIDRIYVPLMPRFGRRRDLVGKKCFFRALAGAVRWAARRADFKNGLRSILADDVIDCDGQYYYDISIT